MKICVIVGTRPDIIKLSPIIRYLHNKKSDYFVIHTGQHYSYNMDKLFFEELELPQPNYNLNVGSKTHGEMTGMMLLGIEKILIKEKPKAVLVLGDTNSTLAGALAASKLHIKLGHVEAGLRSYDRKMPEEINRIVTDHLSDFLFAPTNVSYGNLIQEGIPREKIIITGNPIVDAINKNLEISKKKNSVLKKLNLQPKNYFLLTTHRPENVDNKDLLQSVFNGLKLVNEKYGYPIIFPAHPRTIKNIETFEIKVPSFVKIIPPLGYLEFIQIQNNARLVLTDSGGIQEESCILKVPCVTLREKTERPETIDIGSNILAGTDENKILDCVNKMLKIKTNFENPFGDGNSSERIIKYLYNKISVL